GAGSPTGVVIFSDGAASIGQGTLTTSGGTTTAAFSSSSLAIGSHAITASYAGDVTFAASTGILTQTVGKASSNTLVVSSTNPAAAGQSVTFTATVSGPVSPTGVVTFSDGATSIGQGTLITTGGTTTATFSTASYAGDGSFLASSGTLTQTVGKASSTASVVSSANPSAFSQSVTFTATISGSVGNPTGAVIFSDGATSVGQGTLSTSGGTT